MLWPWTISSVAIQRKSTFPLIIQENPIWCSWELIICIYELASAYRFYERKKSWESWLSEIKWNYTNNIWCIVDIYRSQENVTTTLLYLSSNTRIKYVEINISFDPDQAFLLTVICEISKYIVSVDNYIY